jgi:hypothetical protein
MCIYTNVYIFTYISVCIISKYTYTIYLYKYIYVVYMYVDNSDASELITPLESKN